MACKAQRRDSAVQLQAAKDKLCEVEIEDKSGDMHVFALSKGRPSVPLLKQDCTHQSPRNTDCCG